MQIDYGYMEEENQFRVLVEYGEQEGDPLISKDDYSEYEVNLFIDHLRDEDIGQRVTRSQYKKQKTTTTKKQAKSPMNKKSHNIPRGSGKKHR